MSKFRFWYFCRWSLCASLLTPSISFTHSICAADSGKVDQVLAQEATGQPVNRRDALAQEKDDLSQWQAGRILIDGKWSDLEAIEGQKPSSKLVAYRQQRDSQDLDIEGHRRLAKWCQSHQLDEMADVHWKAVIALDVDDAQARKALKYKRIGNQWFAQDELQRASKQQDNDRIALKKWMPKIRSILGDLQSGNPEKIVEGAKELEKIDSQDSISALMYGAMQVEPSIAVSLVSKIKSMRSITASLALCQIALADPNSEVGRAAIQGLKDYDEHFYVPELLNALELPVKLQQVYFFMPNGSLATRRAYLRETLDEKQEVEIIKLVSVRDGSTTTGGFLPLSPGLGMTITASPEVTAQVQTSLEKAAFVDLRREKRANENFNSLNGQRAKNCKVILAGISGLPADSSVESFWKWWPSFNENPTDAVKPTTSTSYLDDSSYVDVASQVSVAGSGPAALPRHECLVAGTLIQTSRGLCTIEDLKIGDQVISMDVQSGEVSLRPITNVNNRTASESYKIFTRDGDMIQATGGHNWWVLGKGWLRSRQLQEGQFLRTGNASVEITKIEKLDGPIKVYNLIVDQTHTYFVGKDRLLSWDVTSLQPTLQTVPGQRASQKMVSSRK